MATFLITFTDHLPWLFLFASLSAHTAIALSFTERWWTALPTLPRIVFQCIASGMPHAVLLHRFHPVHPAHLYDDTPHPDYANKPRLPGGRPDWDAYPSRTEVPRIYGSGQQLACFALCWIPTLWAVLIAIADNWSLPFTHDRAVKDKRST